MNHDKDRVEGLRSRAKGLGCRDYAVGHFMVEGLAFSVEGWKIGFRVENLGFRI
jgi:hypothetical protein